MRLRRLFALLLILIIVGGVSGSIAGQDVTPDLTDCVFELPPVEMTPEIQAQIDQYTQALEKTPDDTDVLFQRAVLLHETRYLMDAIEDYNRILEIDPSFGEGGVQCRLAGAYWYRSLWAYAQKDYEQAVDDATLALETEPSIGEHTSLYKDRALAYYALGEVTRALDDLDHALTYSEDALTYTTRGYIYLNEEDYDAALDDFNAAIELDDQYAQAYVYRSSIWRQQGDTDAAMDDLDRAIEIDPEDYFSYLRRSYLYFDLEDYDAALEDTQRAIELEPGASYPYLMQGAVYAQLGRDEDAADSYWQWILHGATEGVSEDAIEFSDSVTVEMAEGRVYGIPFEGKTDQVITITADAGEDAPVDPLIVLIDADENTLAADDDGGGDLNSAIKDFVLPADGTYVIVVAHAGGGTDGDVIVTLTLSGKQFSA